MITHMVLLRIRKDAARKDVDRIFTELALLQRKIPGLLSFSGGPYSSPEGMQKGFTHGFCMTFTDAAARDVYLPHPEHERVKAQVFQVLDGGVDGVVAFDYAS
jgi:hypothetical protein